VKRNNISIVYQIVHCVEISPRSIFQFYHALYYTEKR